MTDQLSFRRGPSRSWRTSGPSSRGWPALPRIDRDWAWGGATGAGVTVAIIDSGIEGSHPSVAGRLIESVAVEIVDDEARVVPDEVVICLATALPAPASSSASRPRSRSCPCVCWAPICAARASAFLAGLEWAVERGVQVMNLSLSSKSERLFPFFHETVDDAYFNNVSLVSAVNNVPGLWFPSTFSSVFSVAAHAVADPETFFYNPAPPVEWGAWGVDVPVAWKDGGSTVATGNSFAAPHIAGLVARIASKHPGLTPFEMKAVLAAIANNPQPKF